MGMTRGQVLRDARHKKGLTRQAIAYRLNVSEQQVGRWERDENDPHPANLARLAELYGLTLEELGFETHSLTGEAPDWAKKMHAETQQRLDQIYRELLLIRHAV